MRNKQKHLPTRLTNQDISSEIRMLDKVTGRLKKCDSELEQVAKVGKLKKQEMWNKMAEAKI